MIRGLGVAVGRAASFVIEGGLALLSILVALLLIITWSPLANVPGVAAARSSSADPTSWSMISGTRCGGRSPCGKSSAAQRPTA